MTVEDMDFETFLKQLFLLKPYCTIAMMFVFFNKSENISPYAIPPLYRQIPILNKPLAHSQTLKTSLFYKGFASLKPLNPKGPKWLNHLPSEGVSWGGFKGFLYLLRRCRRTLRERWTKTKQQANCKGSAATPFLSAAHIARVAPRNLFDMLTKKCLFKREPLSQVTWNETQTELVEAGKNTIKQAT